MNSMRQMGLVWCMRSEEEFIIIHFDLALKAFICLCIRLQSFPQKNPQNWVQDFFDIRYP